MYMYGVNQLFQGNVNTDKPIQIHDVCVPKLSVRLRSISAAKLQCTCTLYIHSDLLTPQQEGSNSHRVTKSHLTHLCCICL